MLYWREHPACRRAAGECRWQWHGQGAGVPDMLFLTAHAGAGASPDSALGLVPSSPPQTHSASRDKPGQFRSRLGELLGTATAQGCGANGARSDAKKSKSQQRLLLMLFRDSVVFPAASSPH